MQPKSNFDFLKNTKFLESPTCQEIYNCAICMENTYKSNEECCALKARFFLEDFLTYVVKIKDIKFPKKTFTIGSYYTEPNTSTFYSVFGKKHGDCIICINRASTPYLHKGVKREDSLYNDIVENVYTLLVWLIKELDPSVKITTKFNKDLLPDNPYLAETVLFASVRNTSSDKLVKAIFPQCNTKLLYQVEKKDDKYVLKDITTGKQVETIPMNPEIYSNDAEFETLRRDLDDVKSRLDKTITDEQYSKDLQRQAQKNNELEEKISNNVPTNKQLAVLRNDLKKGLKDKSDIIKNQQEQINSLQDSIKAAKQNLRNQKKQLSQINDELAVAGIHMTEGDAMLSDMHRRLNENDDEIEAIRNDTKEAINHVQKEYEEQGLAFYKKLDSLEKVLTQIALENMRLKEKIEAIDTTRTQPITDYMVVCNHSLDNLNESCILYAQNHNVDELKNKIVEAYIEYTNKVKNRDKEQEVQQPSDSETKKPDITDADFKEIPQNNNDNVNHEISNNGQKKIIIR